MLGRGLPGCKRGRWGVAVPMVAAGADEQAPLPLPQSEPAPFLHSLSRPQARPDLGSASARPAGQPRAMAARLVGSLARGACLLIQRSAPRAAGKPVRPTAGAPLPAARRPPPARSPPLLHHSSSWPQCLPAGLAPLVETRAAAALQQTAVASSSHGGGSGGSSSSRAGAPAGLCFGLGLAAAAACQASCTPADPQAPPNLQPVCPAGSALAPRRHRRR